MAIIIPSKSIYKKDNPKVRDNIIKKVEVSVSEPSLEKDLNKQVYEIPMTTAVGETPTVVEKGRATWQFRNDPDRSYSLFASSYTKVEYGYAYSSSVSIPKKTPNGYISDLKVGKDSEGNNNIKQAISYSLKTEEIEIPFTVNNLVDFQSPSKQDLLKYGKMGDIAVFNSNTSRVEMLPTEYFPEDDDKFDNKVPLKIENISEVENRGSINTNAIANSTIEVNYNDTVGTTSLYGNSNEFFRLKSNLITLYEITIIKVSYGTNNFINYGNNNTIILKGTRETYTPLEGKFTFYGDVVSLKTEDTTEILGDETSKEVTSFDGNELMQKRIPFYTEKCYLSTTGELTYSKQFYCTKDLLRIEPNENYEVDIFNFSSGTTVHSACVYDKNKKFREFISYNKGFTTDNENAYYLGINFINRESITALSGKEYYKANGNIYSVVQNYNKVIDEYKNGKETAVIRCSIVDYYDENGNLTLTPSSFSLKDYISKAKDGNKFVARNSNGEFVIPSEVTIDGITTNNSLVAFNNLVKIDLPYGEYELSVEPTTSNIYGGLILNNSEDSLISQLGEIDVRVYFSENSTQSQKFNITAQKETVYLHLDTKVIGSEQLFKVFLNGKEIKMVFDIYDEVIPMIVGEQGVDKPMSIYKDGNPKKFKVLSARPYFDGAVWQELSLQEIDN